MKVRCPHCQAGLKVDDKFRGRTGPCPRCGAAVLLEPADSENAVAATPAAMAVHAELGPGFIAPPPPGADEIPLVDAVTTDRPVQGPSTVGDFASIPAVQRAGTFEPPKKSKKARLRE